MAKQTNSEDGSTEKEFVNWKFNEVFKRLDRIDTTMSGISAFTKQSDFDSFKKEVNDKYVTKESLTWLKSLGIGVGISVTSAVIIGLMQLWGNGS